MSAQTTAVSVRLRFVSPPPGLAPLTEFALTSVTPELYSLRAVDVDDVRLFLLDPGPYFPGYAPRVSGAVLGEVGTQEPALFVVVRPSDDGAAPSANLLAPVLVNLQTGAALQTILDDDQPLRAPLPR